MKKTYIVTIPIAGHVILEVEADTKAEAKKVAFEMDMSESDATWEALERFNQGNVCYCPNPWEIQIEEV